MPRPRAVVALVVTLASLVFLAGSFCAGSARAAGVFSPARTLAAVPAKSASRTAANAPPRAPSRPPLGSGGIGLSPEAEASASASPSGGDPLVDNGLGSPLCRALTGAELSQAAERNCRSSHFEAAQAPTGDYAFDVHINAGVTNAGNYLSVAVQDAAQWGWMLLVAIVHGVVVMLDWCYTIDLLESSAMRGVTSGLRRTQAAFTQPWLVLAMSIAAVLALYHGIVRRKVTETLGQAVLMGAMMLGGFWVIVNPMGTVGALGEWANEASLGTLAAVMAGTPNGPERTLAEGMGSVFSGEIGGPWCYLEFGDVRWCSDPNQLDSRLHTAALQIATKQRTRIGADSAEMLRAARTNGELFLALPANEAARNSINESGSLFNVLCGGSEEPCSGPTARRAEFRTQSGTAARVIGLFLIWIGVLGMALLVGYIALYLLGAAIASMFLLLLAPAAVIAPALGDGGRAVFTRWAARLVGAVCSKLIFSFLLGVVLLMQRTLMSLTVFGWWAQWLLVSAMWWGAFLKRHQVLGFARGENRSRYAHGALVRRARGKLQNRPGMPPGGMWAKRKLSKPPSSMDHRHKLARTGRERARGTADAQVRRSLEHEDAEAREVTQAGPETRARIFAKGAQLVRVQRERDRARTAGDTRRAAKLQFRVERIEGEVAHERRTLSTARKTVDAAEKAKTRTGSAQAREAREQRARFLDVQAALPSARVRRGSGRSERRDYAAMAGLAGYGPQEYQRLDRRSQRAARLEIDRELALRKELNATAKDVAAEGEGSLGARERRKTDRKFDRTLEQRVRDGGHELPTSARPKPSAIDAYLHDGRARARTDESSVMADAREVAARRKRQLGGERRG